MQDVKVNASSGYGADDLDAKRRNRLPPSLFMRVLAAFFYVVPWLDILSLGWEYHRRFPTSILFLTTVGKSRLHDFDFLFCCGETAKSAS